MIATEKIVTQFSRRRVLLHNGGQHREALGSVRRHWGQSGGSGRGRSHEQEGLMGFSSEGTNEASFVKKNNVYSLLQRLPLHAHYLTLGW